MIGAEGWRAAKQYAGAHWINARGEERWKGRNEGVIGGRERERGRAEVEAREGPGSTEGPVVFTEALKHQTDGCNSANLQLSDDQLNSYTQLQIQISASVSTHIYLNSTYFIFIISCFD